MLDVIGIDMSLSQIPAFATQRFTQIYSDRVYPRH